MTLPQPILHTPSRSIILPPTYSGLLSEIPRSRMATMHGKTVVQVYHDEGATKKLNELGFSIQPPIELYYDWPKFQGRKEPMPHQKAGATRTVARFRARSATPKPMRNIVTMRHACIAKGLGLTRRASAARLSCHARHARRLLTNKLTGAVGVRVDGWVSPYLNHEERKHHEQRPLDSPQ